MLLWLAAFSMGIGWIVASCDTGHKCGDWDCQSEQACLTRGSCVWNDNYPIWHKCFGGCDPISESSANYASYKANLTGEYTLAGMQKTVYPQGTTVKLQCLGAMVKYVCKYEGEDIGWNVGSRTKCASAALCPFDPSNDFFTVVAGSRVDEQNMCLNNKDQKCFTDTNALVKCRSGSPASGCKTIPVKCNASGQWIAEFECIKNCVYYDYDPSHTETYSNKATPGMYVAGTVVNITCLSGDHPLPTNYATCLDNGTWDMVIICRHNCSQPQELSNGFYVTANASLDANGNIFNHSFISLSCSPSYYLPLSNSTAFRAECIDGDWTPDILTACNKGCVSPFTNATVSGGTPIFNNTLYVNDDEIFFSCNASQYLDPDSNTATCQSDGNWDTVSQCYHGCTNISIAHTSVDYSPANETYNGLHKANDNATITCDTDFFFDGLDKTKTQVVAHCNQTGQWDYTPPCVNGCNHSVIVSNATVKFTNNSFGLATVANFSCAGGLYLDPPEFETLCDKHGNWISAPQPQCIPGCKDFSMDNDDASYVIPTVTYNGLHTVLSQVQVSCKQGYKFSDRLVSKLATCEGNGNWSYVPKCNRVCGPAPNVANMDKMEYKVVGLPDATNQTFFDDTVATYTCAYPNTIGSDYAAFPKCKDGSWSAPLPICNFGLFITKTAMTMSCSILIASLIFMIVATLWIRDFSLESVIHLNEEISLLLAHLVLLLVRERVDLGTICNVAGIALQYFFSVNFLFMVFEALQNLSMLQNIISFGGFCVEPRFHNTIVGWVAPLIPTGLTISIFYTDYPSPFSCWVNLTRDSLIGTAIMAPMLICAFLTVILTEAAVMGDIRPMPLTNRNQLIAAHVNQKALVPFVFLNSLSCFVGMVGAYRLDLYLFTIVSASNTTLAVCFIVFHFAGNPKLINWFRSKVVKKIKAKWHRRS